MTREEREERSRRLREEREIETAKNMAIANKIIDKGWKELAKEYHPDKGGKPGEMEYLNELRSTLKGLVEQNRSRFW